MKKANKRFTVMLLTFCFQASLPMWLERSAERIVVSASCAAILVLITLLNFVAGEE